MITNETPQNTVATQQSKENWIKPQLELISIKNATLGSFTNTTVDSEDAGNNTGS